MHSQMYTLIKVIHIINITYKICPESIQPHTMKKIETFLEEDTRYKKYCT